MAALINTGLGLINNIYRHIGDNVTYWRELALSGGFKRWICAVIKRRRQRVKEEVQVSSPGGKPDLYLTVVIFCASC
ncbi:hypothetical protein ABW286_09450 [Erwinia papayae]|uniref:Uncharacterized protein n=1 Tax=Erwinia papayae TaxID=206499 RepID=A0ABV3N0Q9_9GAMM